MLCWVQPMLGLRWPKKCIFKSQKGVSHILIIFLKFSSHRHTLNLLFKELAWCQKMWPHDHKPVLNASQWSALRITERGTGSLRDVNRVHQKETFLIQHSAVVHPLYHTSQSEPVQISAMNEHPAFRNWTKEMWYLQQENVSLPQNGN